MSTVELRMCLDQVTHRYHAADLKLRTSTCSLKFWQNNVNKFQVTHIYYDNLKAFHVNCFSDQYFEISKKLGKNKRCTEGSFKFQTSDLKCGEASWRGNQPFVLGSFLLSSISVAERDTRSSYVIAQHFKWTSGDETC